VRKVNYAKLIDDLWNKEISNDKEEDTIIKKTVANTCFGKLEKGIHKNQRSFLFSSYEECKHYQVRYGGQITVLNQVEAR
jgi:hypothetical protein